MATIEITTDQQGVLLAMDMKRVINSNGKGKIVVSMTPKQARDAGEKLFQAGCQYTQET
jgi:hypothetical protein